MRGKHLYTKPKRLPDESELVFVIHYEPDGPQMHSRDVLKMYLVGVA